MLKSRLCRRVLHIPDMRHLWNGLALSSFAQSLSPPTKPYSARQFFSGTTAHPHPHHNRHLSLTTEHTLSRSLLPRYSARHRGSRVPATVQSQMRQLHILCRVLRIPFTPSPRCQRRAHTDTQPASGGQGDGNSLEMRRRALREVRLARAKERGANREADRPKGAANMAQTQLKISKASNYRRYWLLAFAWLLAMLYITRSGWGPSLLLRVLTNLDLRNPAVLWHWQLLPGLILSDRDVATRYLVDTGLIAEILRRSKEAVDPIEQQLALMALEALVQPGNPKMKALVVAHEGFAQHLLDILPRTGANEQSCLQALRVVYFCLSERMFMEEFMKRDGLQMFCQGAQAHEADVRGYFMHVLSLFLLAQPTCLQSQRSNLTSAQLRTIQLALATSASGFVEEGELNNAIDCYRQLRMLRPENTKMLMKLAQLLRRVGKHKEADQTLQLCNLLNPNQVEGAYGLARRLLRRGESKEQLYKAIKILDDGLEEVRGGDTKASKGAASKSFCLIVSCLNKLREHEEALRFTREWSLRYPMDHIAHYMHGRQLARNGQIDAAAVATGHALAQNPEHAPSHYQMCVVLDKLGRLDEAVEECKRSIAFSQQHLASARARASQKAKDKARAHAKPHRGAENKAKQIEGKTGKQAGGQKSRQRERAVGADVFLARLLLRAGREQEVLQVLDQAMDANAKECVQRLRRGGSDGGGGSSSSTLSSSTSTSTAASASVSDSGSASVVDSTSASLPPPSSASSLIALLRARAAENAHFQLEMDAWTARRFPAQFPNPAC